MKQWMKYIKPYWVFFLVGPLCMIIEVIGEVVMPKLLAEIINNAQSGELTVPSSIWIMVLMVLTAIIMMAGGVGGAYFGAKASVNFATDLRADLYRRIQYFSFNNIDRFSTSSLVTRLTNDVTQMQNFINMLLRMALRAPGMMIAALIMAIRMNASLSIILAIVMPILFLFVGGLILIGFPRFTKMQEKVDALNSTVQENVTNVRVVKSFVREEFETEKFKTANGNLKKAGLSAFNVMIFMSPVMSLIMDISIGVVIWLGAKTVLNGDMLIGDLSAFVTYVSQILFSLMMVTFLLMFSARAFASAKRIKEILNEKIDLTDENAAYPDKKIENGEIEFEIK